MARLLPQCPPDTTIAERLEFYSIPEPNSGCLLWLGGCDGHGHAWVQIDGETRSAHRTAWEQKNGPIPLGRQVLHKCDVRSCINDAHLFLGDPAANMADKFAKGRQSRGISHSKAACAAHALYRAAKAGELRVMAIADDPRPNIVVATELGVRPRTIRVLKRKIAAFRAAHPAIPEALRVAA